MYNSCVNTYYNISKANDLTGSDRRLYRFFEIVPGALAWTTLIGLFLLSWRAPVWAAVFIITFDLYWLIKTVFLSVHMRISAKRLKKHMEIDWHSKLANMRWEHLQQLVILPFYKEDASVVRGSLDAILATPWPKDRMIIVLAREERAGEEAAETERVIVEEYGDKFGMFFTTLHPMDTEGELAGKGSNGTYAAKEIVENYIDPKNIPHKNVIVSAFDIDSRVYPHYFSCVAYHFLTVEKPYRSSFQPVPVYNNNIWDAPMLSRVVASSGTFWQMMQQERPERLTTFSSHSMSLSGLVDVGYWQKNVVSEDSRIFWNHFFPYNGDYRTIPLSYPISLDANVAPTFWETVKNVYKQQRRWGWGVENMPYVFFNFVRNKNIPIRQKIYFTGVLLEGFWSWATNALIIFALGWLPIYLGGKEFNTTLLSYNLPVITQTLMRFAMVGLITSAVISTSLLPPRPKHYGKWRSFSMVFQWVLMPFTIIVFGAIPGLEAQTRLMLGGRWRLGFWVTPKHRR